MAIEDEVVQVTPRSERGWRFDLVLPLFLRPRSTLARIAAHNRANWRAPIALLSLAAVIRALVAGSINAAARATGEVPLPPGYEFYTQEQMAQFQQAATASNNPTFNYILPAVGALLGVIVVWLIAAWVLHLVLTLLGGRGTSQATVNVVAWAGLPALLRFVVQIIAIVVNDSLVAAPGLSGFTPTGEGFAHALLASILSQVDVYLIWTIILLVIGARVVSRLPIGKSTLAVLLVAALVMVLRALPTILLAQFSDLTVIRPFF
jgi:hypothetical protein